MSYNVTLVDEDGIADVISETNTANRRESIQELENHIAACEQVEFEVTHHYADGIYAREVFIPAGSLLTGKIHKTEHLNIISKGDISVATEDGVKRIKAPCTIVSKPGTKRVGMAHSDTIWTTIHASEERDLDALERELIAESFDDFLQYEQNKLLEKS